MTDPKKETADLHRLVEELSQELQRLGTCEWKARSNPVKNGLPATIDEEFSDGKGHQIIEIAEELSSGMSFIHNRNAKWIASVHNAFPAIASSYLALEKQVEELQDRIPYEAEMMCSGMITRVDELEGQVEELEGKLKTAVEALKRLAVQSGDEPSSEHEAAQALSQIRS